MYIKKMAIPIIKRWYWLVIVFCHSYIDIAHCFTIQVSSQEQLPNGIYEHEMDVCFCP